MDFQFRCEDHNNYDDDSVLAENRHANGYRSAVDNSLYVIRWTSPPRINVISASSMKSNSR